MKRLLFCLLLAKGIAAPARLRGADDVAQTAARALDVVWQYDTAG